MKSYKAILFDMDGVIVDSMHWHAESWIRVFQEYGIELIKEDIFKREGMSGIDSITDILREKGREIPYDEELHSIQRKKLEIFETRKVNIFPLTEAILEFVHSRGIKTGLVTGSLRRSVAFILQAPVLSYFNVVITVDDIMNGKPDPEPYLKAIDKLGITPGQALVIENAPLGILSAKDAGADCYAIETSLNSSYLKNADRIFKTHELLYQYFKDNL